MGVSYGISVDLSAIFNANSALANEIFPRIGQAVRAVVQEGEFSLEDGSLARSDAALRESALH